MADMTRPHYQLVADVILKAKLEVEAQKNRWAEERGGEHEMTSLQYASHLSASNAVAKLGESLKKAFREEYANFNEDKFTEAIDTSGCFSVTLLLPNRDQFQGVYNVNP